MRKISIVIIVITMLSVSACKKIQNRVLIKGKWEVERVKSEIHKEDNSMELLLQGYISNNECCQYIVDFKDDQTVTGTFYKDKQVMQIDSGEWKLDEFNLLDIQLGMYINGTYDVKKDSKRFYILTTDSNEISILNSVIKTKIAMEIRRLKD